MLKFLLRLKEIFGGWKKKKDQTSPLAFFGFMLERKRSQYKDKMCENSLTCLFSIFICCLGQCLACLGDNSWFMLCLFASRSSQQHWSPRCDARPPRSLSSTFFPCNNHSFLIALFKMWNGKQWKTAPLEKVLPSNTDLILIFLYWVLHDLIGKKEEWLRSIEIPLPGEL